jgi:hypothetical protein
MEKLIELLNESEDWFVSKFVSYDNMSWVFRLDNWQSFHYTLIFSREYCFINWLVNNDKIDLLKLTCMNPRYTEILDSDFSWEDRIIMILSIQDEPIDFLLSILK